MLSSASLLWVTLAAAPDPSRPPTADELGTICHGDAAPRRITVDDALQMAKMIDGETWGTPSTEDARAMLWAIAARSGMWRFPSWTLADLIRSYSQPINPAWTRTGSKCKKYYAAGFTGEIPDSCSVKRVDRREQNIKMAWADTALVARKEVLEFAAGRTTSNPVVGMVGWFGKGMWNKREGNGANTKDHMLAGATLGGNVYVELSHNPDTTAWTADHVRIVGPGKTCDAKSPEPKAPEPKAAPKAAAGPSCATEFTYHKDGVVFFAPPMVDPIPSLVISNAGSKQKVCGDSTGMIYVGNSEAFLTDTDGNKIRFVVTALGEDSVTVAVTHGKLTRSLLKGNTRVVLRRRP